MGDRQAAARSAPRPAEPPPRPAGPRARPALIGLSGAVLVFALGCGMLLAGGSKSDAEPRSVAAAVVVNYANAALPAAGSGAALDKPEPAPALLSGNGPQSPAQVAEAMGHLPERVVLASSGAPLPAPLQALRWWNSAADAARLGEQVSLGAADTAAIARLTRPVIPALSTQTLFGARPAQFAPVEFAPVVLAEDAAVCDGRAGTLITDTLRSGLLSRPLPVHVWLPPCHDPLLHKYPAVYLLQGSGYQLGQWLVHGAPQAAELLINSGAVKPFILVMPGNDMWINGQGKYMWSEGGPGSWETVIADQLVPMIEQKYGAKPEREARALAGISRGGYWALEIGFARPELFGTVAGHSPAISTDILIGEGNDFSMLTFAKSVDALKTQRLWLDAGDTDWARTGMDALSKQLKERGVKFARSIGKGGHEDDLWTSRIDDYMAFYSRGWSTSPNRVALPDVTPDGGQ